MKPSIVFALVFVVAASVFGQEAQPKIKVYLLGTFHFAQTDSTYDVLSEQHQRSIAKLCESIQRHRPDKVFVERMPEFEYQNRVDSLYQVYRAGQFKPRRNEIYQVGFRVAKALGHPTIYQCDHPGMYGTYYQQCLEYAEKNGQMDILNAKAKGTTQTLEDRINNDSLFRKLDLLDYLKWLNSEPLQRASHAHYINVYPQVGYTDVFDTKRDDNYFLGSELTADWYRRNIKIYSKMIAQLDYSEQAIFLLIGNDHVPIIRHLFESNPWFEVVATEEWLND